MKKFLFIIFTFFYTTFSYAEILAYKCIAQVGKELSPPITFIIDTKKEKITTPEGNEMKVISLNEEVFVFKSTDIYTEGLEAKVDYMTFFISRVNTYFGVIFHYVPELKLELLKAEGECKEK